MENAVILLESEYKSLTDRILKLEKMVLGLIKNPSSTEYHTVEQAAKSLKMHPDTLRKWLKEPNCPIEYKQPGRTISISVRSITEYNNTVTVHKN